MAPHLTDAMPIMLPLYGPWWRAPYYWAGTKAYDLIASRHGAIQSSFTMGKERALREFPLLKRAGLLGALVYYDGQQDDARMNVALAMTAMRFGAIMCNYVRVVGLLKTEDGQLCGAVLQDTLQPDQPPFRVKAKGIINATGPFCDAIRLLDDPGAERMISASSGVHIVLPEYYSPRTMGLLDPATKDKRVIFFLPWQHNSLAGTTDAPTDTVSVDCEPEARQADIDYILDELNGYLEDGVKMRRCDVISAWAGLRPLVRDPKKRDTASVVRNHLIDVSAGGLLTITGGKWTTFRQMAQETIDTAVSLYRLEPLGRESRTNNLRLIGAHHYTDTLYIKLIQQFGYDTLVAKHLARSYGDRALGVALLDTETQDRAWPLSGGSRLTPYYPYLEAEVRWAVRHEQAMTPQDILCRRTRLAFHNCRAALEALPRVCLLMQQELGWTDDQRDHMLQEAKEHLGKLGLPVLVGTRTESTREQVQRLKALAREWGPNGYVPRGLAEAVLGRPLPKTTGDGVEREMVSLVELLEVLHQ